jgi:hypothetical protein
MASHFGTYAAGTNADAVIFVGPSRCWVYRVAVVNAETIAQDDDNYSIFTVRNAATRNVLATANTTRGGVGLRANTITDLTEANITEAGAYLAKDDVLVFEKSHAGTGQRTDEMRVIVYFVPMNTI